jgi:hypothetical protein
MSGLLRAVRSLDQSGRYRRPSEEGDMPSERPVARLRDFDAPESEAKSSPFGDQPRAGALLKKLNPWQVRATAPIPLLGPPAASLILLAVYYFEYWRTVPFNFADFLVVFFLFAIPAGYAFGAVPALLAALFYCALLTAHSRLLRPLIRACVAAICGGFASWGGSANGSALRVSTDCWVRSSWPRCRCYSTSAESQRRTAHERQRRADSRALVHVPSSGVEPRQGSASAARVQCRCTDVTCCVSLARHKLAFLWRF